MRICCWCGTHLKWYRFAYSYCKDCNWALTYKHSPPCPYMSKLPEALSRWLITEKECDRVDG